MNTYTMTGFKVENDKLGKIQINAHRQTLTQVRAVLKHCFTSSATNMMPRAILQSVSRTEIGEIVDEIVDETLTNIDKGEIIGMRNPTNTLELVVMTDNNFEANYHMIHDEDTPPKDATIQ